MLNTLAAGLSLVLYVTGAPREILSMSAVEEVVNQDTLVVFDIDNTLVQPVTELGSDQWFFFLIERFEQQGLSAAAALARANEVWNATQWLVKVEPVEAQTPALVKRLQARGLRVMALTARDRASAAVTHSQLAQIGVNFVQSSPVRERKVFSAKELGGGEDGELLDGVFMIGETNEKGRSLAALLATLPSAPARVVFIDDKLKHTVSVTAAMEARGIPCTALRYGAADSRVQRFQAVMAVAKEPELARLFLTGELVPTLVQRADAARQARGR